MTMPRLLAVETTSEACSVALSLEGEVQERFAMAPRGHAELVLPWVSALLADAGVALGALDAIAFSRGPGSFTSLRIGISVVQGLAWGAGLPVIPVSSLQTAAQAAVDAGVDVDRAIVAMDARMDEVYCGRYAIDARGLMTPAGDERVCRPAELAQQPPEAYAGIGNGFERFEVLATYGRNLVSLHPQVWPRAAALIRLAGAWLAERPALPAEEAQPVYLRDRVAGKPGR